MTSNNRRQFTRIVFSAPGELRQGAKKWHCSLLDISLKGVLLTKPEKFEVKADEPVLLVISLPGMANSIMLEGLIRHQEEEQLGIQIKMIDIDSASSLRRLVELNVGDDALLKRELEALASPNEEELRQL
ncbi:PilZ domain-containing protein [Aliiglaciecola sp. CAU 1673]|uniref:PilZ domain-containing protein n=1 Tax=Aliiglaciecola sp. CAU 1673 TaxID=3032595 RepID=UPI0023DA2F8A|nr:PilZ domain-containing protein [Aliiglaciecola sp. CAU 1673]MDF2178011.1 PilZ domain-containing protein [Aliiglaciecola sp. CAU 1673]